MFKSDLKYRRWNSTKAELAETAKQANAQKEYRRRLNRLVEIVVKAVRQKELHYYLVAPDEPTLLLALKEAVDYFPGGFMARHPDPDRTGHSAREQSERAMFMKAAYDRAVKTDQITVDTTGSGQILLYSYCPPKYVLYRDGNRIEDYVPTKEELNISEVSEDVEPEFVHTDRTLARFGRLI
jgi:hypothetical protein